VLFAAFTGEEKGLLGSRWFVAHPTVPIGSIVADINLDQLRPIFPLDLLTVHALDDSTLGDAVRSVASGLGIEVQLDPEPQRQLLRRSDHWPFIQAGIPATGFVFGYRPGSESEQRYRHWYQVQYHRPQDDLSQPMDWTAAGKFNRFFYALVANVANGDAPPKWQPGSPLAPAKADQARATHERQ
jgi:Zn-dependent M28 family amino/carboxypeptidase